MGGDSYVSTSVRGRPGPQTPRGRRDGAEAPDPYGDAALLTPAMTRGYDVVPDGERDRLLRYLEAVVGARPAPVHTAVAFNAAYFGYDLGGDGYGGSPLRLDDFPVITFGESTPVLPVGAMVCVSTGSDPLYAEIVYREGAHPAVGALGDVPAWVSGAPAGAEGPGTPGSDDAPRRRELLVPDLHAFGPALSLSPAQLHRLRTHQRWINADGHVLVDVCYPSREAARHDDLTAYVEHLLTTARDQLLSPFVPVSLAALVGSTNEDDLRAGLLGLLDTVRGVLDSSPVLRSWGHYAMTRASLADAWRDTGPLGGDDLRSLAAAVEHAATPARRRRGLTTSVSIYTAVGPRLRGFPGATELLKGVGYAGAVCWANVALADVVQSDSDRGRFDNGSRITFDDAFEGGGVWRSHHPGDAEAPGDPLVPVGRGWISTCTSSGPEAGPEPEPDVEVEPLDRSLADDASLGSSELLRIGAEEIVWRLPLRLAHLIEGWLPLHPDVAREMLRSHRRDCVPRLVLDHRVQGREDHETVQDISVELDGVTDRLTGISWPRDFFAGLLLELRWPRGGIVVHAATIRLAMPVQVGGRVAGHCFDPRVLTREDAPGSDRHGDTAVGLGPRQLVMRTVRRCGLLTLDGHALLDRSVLPQVAYGRGPARSQVAALEAAVAELLGERLLEPALGSRDAWGQPHYPAREDQTEIPLIGFRPAHYRVRRPWGGPTPAGEELRSVQFVAGHLRRLLPGRLPSGVQRAAFREYCRGLGKADGWELPYGYTFVTAHQRGN
ncbi:hypothetical protein ACIRP0_05435 [Streptomyces sp. NPDC101733]|uniref:hypothetical protein n=1 Tax=unclassified Streptomyces TaxID=2593676 RepID=UPI0037FD7260